MGFGISPDYLYTIKNTSDFLNNPMRFGVGYISEIDDLARKNEIYNSYSFHLNNT